MYVCIYMYVCVYIYVCAPLPFWGPSQSFGFSLPPCPVT